VSEMKTGGLITGRPKSDAGARVVAFPEVIIGDRVWHLQRFSEPAPEGLVFVGETGAQLRRSNFTKVWAKALAKTGLPKFTFMTFGTRVTRWRRPLARPSRS
jgi:hypothetical protein